MRTIVDLPSEQLRGLEQWCLRDGISRAEAIRRALARMLAELPSSNRADAFGAWQGKKLDSAKFIRTLRQEWEK